MKAYQLTPGGGIDGLRQVELPDPEPGPGELLLRVRATSLNYRDLMRARSNPKAIIPLSDGAGDVVAVGDGVASHAPGDRATSCFFPNWIEGPPTAELIAESHGGDSLDGTLAELVVLPARAVVPTPTYMTDEEAATLPCSALTAWAAMFEAGKLRPGQTVLLLGTGGVSIAGLQLAHLAGVRSIITSSSDEKLERARALGADETINYRAHDDWEQLVLELTDGEGVDVALEVAGTFGKTQSATKVGGVVVLIGRLASTGISESMPLLKRGVTATRIMVGSRAMFAAMNRALELREVHPVIDRVFGFDEAAEAYRHLESQQHFGKVAIRL